MPRMLTKEDRAAARGFYTAGRTKITIKGLDLEIYLSDTPSAMAFRGTAGKPFYHYRFRDLAQRESAIKRLIESERSRQQIKASYKAKKESPSQLQPGHILVASWGYDQTNINFYQIIECRGKRTIIVQELTQIRTETLHMQGNCTPGAGFKPGARPITCRVTNGTNARIEGNYASLWDGRPCSWSSYA